MRSEKEVREKLETARRLKANAEVQGMRSLVGIYEETIATLEWVLTEAQSEQLTPIELKELRAILAEHRKKPGYPGTAGGSGIGQFPVDRS